MSSTSLDLDTPAAASLAAGVSGIRAWWTARQARRAELLDDVREVDTLIYAWREACEGAGVAMTVDTATGGTVVPPRIVHVVLGPPTVLTVRLLPGQVVADLRRVAYRVAGHLGAGTLRVTAQGVDHARVELVHSDPLADPLPLPLADIRPGYVLLGRDEGGELLAEPGIPSHVCVQGVTRSGKSVWSYGTLAQLAPDPAVLVAGSDPTGLLLGRVWDDTRHREWQVAGLADPPAHVAMLARVVREMDRRIADLPLARDAVDTSPDLPLLVVVMEEYPGLLRALDAIKTRESNPGAEVRSMVARLLAEGAKAGVRVMLIAQRAEAAVVGAFERSQCSLRISFRVDNRASVELLHPGADPETADAHTTAPAGVALVSTPGRPLLRVRGPLLGGDTAPGAPYRAYVEAIGRSRRV